MHPSAHRWRDHRRGRRRFHHFRHPVWHHIHHKLQWRIFFWFAAAIALTALTAAGIARTLPSHWQKRAQGVPKLMSTQFAQVWDDPQARSALLRDVSQAIDLGMRLLTPSGQVLDDAGPSCQQWTRQLPVQRNGVTLGAVELCRPRDLWHMLLPLGGAVMVLLALSGGVARRLGRPLSELARVAQEIGRGNLKARVPTSRMPSEARVVADSVNEMAARIEKQLGDQRELLAAVSHELRTPLQRIRLLAELGRGGGFTDQSVAALDREVVEIDSLVGELLANARLDFGSISVRPLDLRDLCAESLERAGLAAELLSVDGEPRLEGDPTLLSRALANLLSNASRHGGGVQKMGVVHQGEAVRVTVEDDGPGFSAEQLSQVFEPFYRQVHPPRAQRAPGGLGLGLSLVKRIAEAHRGSAFAENRPEGGARVGMVLPASS